MTGSVVRRQSEYEPDFLKSLKSNRRVQGIDSDDGDNKHPGASLVGDAKESVKSWYCIVPKIRAGLSIILGKVEMYVDKSEI